MDIHTSIYALLFFFVLFVKRKMHRKSKLI
nr:MAG TPA: hypothetical protein [Bacteriophage sp.]